MIQKLAEISDTPIIRAADVTVVGAAITSPWWRPALHEWSSVAADLLPIAGLVWIVIQISCRLWMTARAKSDAE